MRLAEWENCVAEEDGIFHWLRITEAGDDVTRSRDSEWTSAWCLRAHSRARPPRSRAALYFVFDLGQVS